MKIKLEKDRADQDLYRGMIRLHILHHASKKAVFGFWFIEELARHGYPLSPGTLYPILHGLERQGYLKSEKQLVRGKVRKCYRATRRGKSTLTHARTKARELLDEIS